LKIGVRLCLVAEGSFPGGRKAHGLSQAWECDCGVPQASGAVDKTHWVNLPTETG